ncbi:MAG TPA: 5-formyltetrahydrofolate cyclo-ligase [Acidimicrobiia bacterium]|nr:5-formyltetrahydrofolate cyclo-ligase [Acidimicrobiia bacterium]
MDKAATRVLLRDRPPVTAAESDLVTGHLREWLADRDISRILVYLPMPGEVDVTGVIDDRHQWFVTRTPGGDRPLTVHSIDAPREVHRFGYEQPVAQAAAVDPATLDIVLTPALSFDRRGNRLGWGKGYYDGLFGTAPAVTAVGITLERLVVDRVPTESHDRRMDWLATDGGVRRAHR